MIFLNGCTSAGKTSIAQALQARLDPPHLHYGIDDAFAMLPLRLHDHADGFFFDRDVRGLVRLNHGPFGAATLRAYRRAAAVIAGMVDIIVDEVVLDAAFAADWISVARNLDVVAIGIHCDLDELERREVVRGDRLAGQARGQYDIVHRWFRYDLEIDTTSARPEAAADTISAALDTCDRPRRLTACGDA